MEEQLQAALAELIKTATDGAKFIAGEIPDVINQLLMWKLFEGLFFAALGAVLFASCMIVQIKRITPFANEQKELGRLGDASGAYVLSGFMWVIAGGTSLALASNILTSAKILIAPKIYLIEYAASLVK